MEAGIKVIRLARSIVFLSSITCAFGGVITPSPAGDGMVGRDWSGNPNFYWVDNTSESVQAYHDGSSRWWYRGMVLFDINSLLGKTLEPGEATFNFYSFGFSSTVLQYANVSGPVMAANAGWGQLSGAEVGWLGPSGWQSFDVTPFLQGSINSANRYVGLIFSAYGNYNGGTLASSEDGLGRGPYLQIGDAGVPEPSSMALLGLGFATLAAFRRKRKAAI
jgi:hypothetical protein